MKKTGTFIAGFLVGIVVIYGWGQLFGSKTSTKESPIITDISTKVITKDEATESIEGKSTNINTNNQNRGIIASEGLTVAAQPASNSVLINSINMPESGWIVVHEVKDGVIANALGAARRDAGQYTDVTVYLLRDTIQNGEYMVVLYKDNGDKTFDLSADKPFANANGEHIMSKFIAQ